MCRKMTLIRIRGRPIETDVVARRCRDVLHTIGKYGIAGLETSVVLMGLGQAMLAAAKS